MYNDLDMYWNSLTRITGDTKKPIYQWECFKGASIDELNGFIQDIAEQIRLYETSDYSPIYNGEITRKIYSILFLVRCALISRCSDDWNLMVSSKYAAGLDWGGISTSDWISLIKTAERALSRTPLTADLNGSHYCARVVVESGIPLKALQNPKSKIVEGLKSIWAFRSSCSDTPTYNKAIREFESTGILKNPNVIYPQIFPLPGGMAGCRAFFDMGLSLLRRAVNASKEANGCLDGVTIFSNLGFINPSKEAIDNIFGTSTIPQSMPELKSNATPNAPRILRKRTIVWKGKTL